MSKLLLIEDEIEPGLTIQRSIESSLGCTVYLARNESEALEAIQNVSIKVAIIDQRLKNGELGTEIFKKIKVIRSDIVAIMLSSKAIQSEIGEALDMGYFTYIDKIKDTLKIPEKISEALQVYDTRTLSEVVSNENKLLLTYRTSSILFWKSVRVYLFKTILIDSQFVFDEDWKEEMAIDAGTDITETIKFTYETEVRFEHNTITETLVETSASIKHLPSSVTSKISSKLNEEMKTLIGQKLKKETEFSYNLKLPSIPDDTSKDYLARKSFQSNQVFKKYLTMLRLDCPLCQTFHLVTLKVFVPTNKIAKRQIDVLKSGKKSIIDCGIISK